MSSKTTSGFTFLELLIVIGVSTLLSFVILTSLISFRKNQALDKDTELVVELLTQARNQTLSSKNATVYGVHFSAPQVTLFAGAAYVANAAGNEVINLTSTDTILTVSLNGGGNDVVFQRLSGETAQNGTVVVSSAGIGRTKTVTIYKTGLTDSQ